MNSQFPQVIFLDAVGTLFGVKGTVGEQYQKIARLFGVETESSQLEQAFLQSFMAAPPMAFPGTDPADIPPKEFEWWQAVSRETFVTLQVLDQFSDFGEFFRHLYNYFTTAEPWEVYPDVKPTLSRWQAQGAELGVLSNFDTRLYAVLNSLELASFFHSVTISTEVGTAKPDPQIFHHALAKHGGVGTRALHIGDSLKADYHGAKMAGFQAIWLNRTSETPLPPIPDNEHYNSLDALQLTV